MKIIIKIIDDQGELFGRREALSFESAEENLGKLERAYQSKLTADKMISDEEDLIDNEIKSIKEND